MSTKTELILVLKGWSYSIPYLWI